MPSIKTIRPVTIALIVAMLGLSGCSILFGHDYTPENDGSPGTFLPVDILAR